MLNLQIVACNVNVAYKICAAQRYITSRSFVHVSIVKKKKEKKMNAVRLDPEFDGPVHFQWKTIT